MEEEGEEDEKQESRVKAEDGRKMLVDECRNNFRSRSRGRGRGRGRRGN